MKTAVVIVAAGRGKRMQRVNKALLTLGGKKVIEYSLDIFCQYRRVEEIVIVLRDGFKEMENLVEKYRRRYPSKVIKLVKGGRERKDSVWNGISILNSNIEYVLIHDCARPFIRLSLIRNILFYLKRYYAVIPGQPVRDTIKEVRGSISVRTLDRDCLYAVGTPQGFRRRMIEEGLKTFRDKRLYDDAQVLELMGKRVKIIKGDIFNFKITYPDDLKLAQIISKFWEIE